MLAPNEKRDFTRMQAHCKMRFRIADSDTFTEATCGNISGSGILFEAPVPVAAGKAAEIHIEPVNRITPPLTAYIEVIRCESVGNDRYEIAGAIKGIKSTG